MLGLTLGEWFVVGFIVVAIVTARYWPIYGERIARSLSRDREPEAGSGTDGPR